MPSYSRLVKNRVDLWKHKYFSLRNLIVAVLALVLVLIVAPFLLIHSVQHTYDSLLFTKVDDVPVTKYAIVFGASVYEEGTTDVVRERISAAVDLLKAGKVEKLLLSGSTDDEDYNEPQQMHDLAITLGAKEEQLITDNKGDSTFVTCQRARQEYKINEAVLVTQDLHLRRALYICNSLGIKSSGYVADLQDIDYTEDAWREAIAVLKAVWEVTTN